MSLSGSFPILVIMERYQSPHRWAAPGWRPCALLPGRATDIQPGAHRSASQLLLELYDDDGDGYYENWAGPEPKVFILWRTQGEAESAQAVRASVSYAEGTRMLDSGETADTLPMPPEVHQWLGHWLQLHYRPKARRGREHG